MDNPAQLVVVCGLGGLGHACLRTLRHFDVPLNCLDLAPLPMGMDMGKDEQWVVGDMRNPDALQHAGVSQARAVLLLSTNSGVNLEASLQVRLLNPAARVVVRSNGSGSLERHLRERLPGLVLIDPELLTAGVFANALRPDGSEAAFLWPAKCFGWCEGSRTLTAKRISSLSRDGCDVCCNGVLHKWKALDNLQVNGGTGAASRRSVTSCYG